MKKTYCIDCGITVKRRKVRPNARCEACLKRFNRSKLREIDARREAASKARRAAATHCVECGDPIRQKEH